MKSADYQCPECSDIIEIFVKDDEEFPTDLICEKCRIGHKRKFAPAFKICHQGRCGNDKNGYTSNKVSIKKT